jgi:Uri superfamily endonuclease
MTPRQPGSYVLIMQLPQPTAVAVGQLGRFKFPPGWYAYAGSALGPGGLAARVRRHRRASKTLHWHIDYFRAHAKPVAVWYAVGVRRRECHWAQALSELPGASVPAARFGASDCQCPAHLIHFPNAPTKSDFARSTEDQVSEDALGV